jgi:hypothetical protein
MKIQFVSTTFLMTTLCFISGCSSGPAISVKQVAFKAPTGWSKGMSDDQTVNIAIAPGWRQGVDRIYTPATDNPLGATTGAPTDLMGGQPTGPGGMPDPVANQNEQDMKRMLDNIDASIEKDSKEYEKKELEELAKKGVLINVISGGKPTIGEARTRYFVVKTSQGSNWSWAEAEANERGKFVKKPAVKEVDLPIGKAHRMEETRQLVDGAFYTIISYLVPNGKDLYTIRFITEEQAMVVTQIDKEVAESLRILK